MSSFSAEPRRYVITAIPGFFGDTASEANDINNNGDVVGGLDLAYLYSGGVTRSLGTIPPNANSAAYGINDLGHVVGRTFDPYEYAFLYTSDRGMQYLGGGSAADINNAGEIVGRNANESGINNLGRIATYIRIGGYPRAAIYNVRNNETNFLDSGSRWGSYALSINDTGQVTGVININVQGHGHAFFYNGGGMQDIGTLGGNDSYPYRINNEAQIVGRADTTAGESHAFLWENGTMIDLNDVLPPGSHWELYDARGINDAGQICGNGSLGAFILTPVVSAPTITLHRLTQSALLFSSLDELDDPLTVTNDAAVLGTMPELGIGGGAAGFVADGVTPLLLKFRLSDHPPEPITYQISFAVQGGSPRPADLEQHLMVLQTSGWTNTSTLVFTTDTGFAQIMPFSADELQLNPMEFELTITVTLTNVVAAETASRAFKIRKPPVVLLHGYGADSSTWGGQFTNAFPLGRSNDFVIPVNYGVNSGTAAWYPNTYWRLDALARDLDRRLRWAVEEENASLHLRLRWAFTRYDVVGHSQGGVLARMLCASSPTQFFPAFRNSANFHRGRFHRVITIGSPHNGSRLLYYAQKLLIGESASYRWFPRQFLAVGGLYPLGQNVLQSKFDPFGPQIEQVNTNAIDREAPFHLIQTTISCGEAPGAGSCPNSCPRLHRIAGLCHLLPDGRTRGNIIVPSGSDGIVDLASQRAGAGTPATAVDSATEVSHSSDDVGVSIFGVRPEQCQTQSSAVSEIVKILLNGPSDAFGSFVLPTRVPNVVKAAIDAIIPSRFEMDLIRVLAPSFNSGTGASSFSSTFSFRLEPSSSEPVHSEVMWFVEVFGTNGVSTSGVSLQVSTNDSTIATVCVDNGVVGDVILYANYSSTNGNMVVSKPVLVLSRPVGTNLIRIELTPPSITMSPGDELVFDIWGVYDNGARAVLYLPVGSSAEFSSGNEAIVHVDTNGVVFARGFGAATVTAQHSGFAAQALVLVLPPNGRSHLTARPGLNPGNVELTFVGEAGTNHMIEVSTDLHQWQTLTNFFAGTGLMQFRDTMPIGFQHRFYRAISP